MDGRRGGGHDGRGRHCERERRNPVGDWRGVSGFWAWERRGGHQLDRFTFVRDDGIMDREAPASLFVVPERVRAGRRAVQLGGVIASGSDAIQLGIGEGSAGGVRAWERLGGNQLDRFTFVVQNDSQDRFAAAGGHASLRDDGCEGCASGGHASPR